MNALQYLSRAPAAPAATKQQSSTEPRRCLFRDTSLLGTARMLLVSTKQRVYPATCYLRGGVVRCAGFCSDMLPMGTGVPFFSSQI